MPGFKCPFCQQVMSVNNDTKTIWRFDFDRNGLSSGTTARHLEVVLYRCPSESCRKISAVCRGVNGFLDNVVVPIYPQGIYVSFPEYVPEAIRSDYEEACKIMHLSPKASATLARRCLQGMIHDFWDIHERNLNAEITRLKDKVPAAQWKAIDAVRKIGNIGAHMEHDVSLIVDIDSDEAQKLLKLIEHLIEMWYINRHESELLYADLVSISDEKSEARKG